MLRFSLGWTVVLLPLAGGGDPASTNFSPNVVAVEQISGGVMEDAVATSDASVGPDIPAAPAGSAPAPAAPPPPNLAVTSPVADVVKLAQAGVDESVLLTFVTNSPNTFNLSSDAIVYLSDLGVSSEVVNAMIQHDQMLKANAALASTPPTEVNPAMPTDTGAGYPTDTSNSDTAASTQPDTTYVQNPPDLTDSTEAAAEPNVSYTYFYNSLAPYGAWITVGGYGPCWRPTACAITPGWQPYCNAGHWVYTDCGWYWASSYSWGWAPFHYGRWFYAPHYGWCWSPGRVWSPAWVCWRYTSDHCGWAPLPPSAYYRPGVGFTYYGRSVGLSFNFGLQPSSFVFVPTSRFCDPRPSYYRVPNVNAVAIYNRSVPYNRFGEGQNHVVINKGIPVERITAATHAPIQPVVLRDVPGPDGAQPGRFNGGGNTLAVYRPVPPAPGRGGPAPAPNSPSLPTQRPGVAGTGANPGFGAHTPGPQPVVHNPAPVATVSPGNPWRPPQANPAPVLRTGPSPYSGTPSQIQPGSQPPNSWSLPRRGEGGNQILMPSQNHPYPAGPQAPRPAWGNNAAPAHPSPVPASPEFGPRQAPVPAAPAVPQHNNYVSPQPTRSAPPQQQSPSQSGGARH